ncbi:hypothetical protein C8R43DRAFT_1037650 [Mycena crocata]|nr:hypothetical protein C8R43DRAFT_1037650 [Mycena crocata]
MLFALAYGSFGDVLETAKLAVKIVQILRDGRKLSRERLALAVELQTLNNHLVTLKFIASGIHVDPLCSRSLYVVACIRSEVDSCRTILTRILQQLDGPRGIFGMIALAISEESELARLRSEISRPLSTIRTLMLTLNLIASQGIGAQLNGAILQLEQIGPQVLNVGSEVVAISDKLVATGDKVDLYGDRLAAVHEAVLKLPIARGVSDDILFVVDPIGGNIPISLRYCHAYADVDRIIKAHLLHRPDAGSRYIERGDYHIVSGEEGATILPMEFARKVQPGMQVEMSIVKRQLRNRRWGQMSNAQCPHCNRNDADELGNGWHRCTNLKCARRYRMNLLDEEDIAKVAEIQEIVSPQIRQASYNRQDVSDEPESFRLVHVYTTPEMPIWMADAPPPPPLPQASPGWRTVPPQTRKTRKRNLPPLDIPSTPMDPRRQVKSWATWQPNINMVPTPPSSPGLFGPRTPRDFGNYVVPESGSPGLFGPRSPRHSGSYFDPITSTDRKPTLGPDMIPPPSVDSKMRVPDCDSPGLFGPRSPYDTNP